MKSGNVMYRKLIFSLFTAFALLLSAGAMAQGMGQGPGQGPGQGQGPGFQGSDFNPAQHLIDALGLSDDQAEQVQLAFEAAEETRDALRAEQQAGFCTIQAVLDEALQEILDEAQYDELEALRAEREARRAERALRGGGRSQRNGVPDCSD